MTLQIAQLNTTVTGLRTCPAANSANTMNDTQDNKIQTNAANRIHLTTIPCPALRGFYQNKLLNPDDNGSLEKQELYQALRGVGITHSLTQFLLKQAPVSSDDKDNIALFKLRDSSLDHSGSSGILDPIDNPSRLDEFLAISENTQLYLPDIAAACNAFTRISFGSLLGTTFHLAAWRFRHFMVSVFTKITNT